MDVLFPPRLRRLLTSSCLNRADAKIRIYDVGMKKKGVDEFPFCIHLVRCVCCPSILCRRISAFDFFEAVAFLTSARRRLIPSMICRMANPQSYHSLLLDCVREQNALVPVGSAEACVVAAG